jgi:hypothetical protein
VHGSLYDARERHDKRGNIENASQAFEAEDYSEFDLEEVEFSDVDEQEFSDHK